MKEKIIAKLEEMKKNKDQLSSDIQKAEEQKNQMNANFIAISGAIQVLEMVLKEDEEGEVK